MTPKVGVLVGRFVGMGTGSAVDADVDEGTSEESLFSTSGEISDATNLEGAGVPTGTFP